jgi:hypothetical protein
VVGGRPPNLRDSWLIVRFGSFGSEIGTGFRAVGRGYSGRILATLRRRDHVPRKIIVFLVLRGVPGQPACPAEDLGGRLVGYTTAMWLSFGEALAAVAGALTGLLFVAVSVKSDALAASRSLSSRAAQTLVLFLTSVLIAILLVAPQSPAALGSELIAVAVFSGAALLVLDRRAGHATDRGVASYIERFSPNSITAVLVGVAGITFLLKAGGGLYWLIPAAVASLLGGVVNAWLFLVKVTS